MDYYKKTRINGIHFFLLLPAIIILLSLNDIKAQGITWNSVLTVTPTPSPYISDWENDPRMLNYTVIYNGKSPVKVTFRGILSSDRFGKIGTVTGNSDVIPTGPFTKTYRNTETLHINESNLDKNFIKTVLKSGRLPEDDYTLCISLHDQNGAQLTEACAYFSITLPDQPQLVFPFDGDTINTGNPTFQWTPVFGAPGKVIRYVFRMCEILNKQLPLNALSSNVPVFEKILTNTTMFLYPPDALPIEKGKKYVWQVQALDENGFPASVNQGKSEIWTFNRKFGSLFYYDDNLDLTLNTKISGNIQYDWPGASRSPLPMKNTLLGLYVEYILQGQGLPIVLTKGDLQNKYPDCSKWIASATSDASGNFKFSFSSNDSTYLIAEDTTLVTESKGTIQGDLYRVLRVRVMNQYYVSPSKNIMFNGSDPVDVGTITAKARRFDLHLKLWDPLLSNQDTLKYKVKVTRKGVKPEIPLNEGESIRTENNSATTYTIFDKNVNKNGSIILSCLVQNRYQGDEYNISFHSTGPNSAVLYSPIQIKFDGKTNSTYNYNQPDDKAIYTDEYPVKYLSMDVNPSQVSVKLSGKLRYKFYGKTVTHPLKNVNTQLVLKYILHKDGGGYMDVSNSVSYSDKNKVLANCTTDSLGNVSYNVFLQQFMLDSLGTSKRVTHFNGSNVNGYLHRTLRVIVNNPYYCSPDEGNNNYGDINFNIQSHYQNFGTLVSLVRSYNVVVKLKDSKTKLPINNIDTYICRLKRPYSAPEAEGNFTGTGANKFKWENFEIVSKGTSGFENGEQGRITLTELVRNMPNYTDDNYYLILEANPQVYENYNTRILLAKYDIFQMDFVHLAGTYNTDYGSPGIKTLNLEMVPKAPYVTAKFRKTDSEEPAEFVYTYLTNVGGQSISDYSDAEGIVKFSPLPENPNGPKRSLISRLAGYRDTVITVENLREGQKHDLGIIPLKPRSKIKGTVVDETGNPVASYISVDDGIRYKTNCTSLNIVLGNFTCTEQSFEMPAPSGNRKVTIEPVNHDKYFTVDTSLYISPGERNIGELTIYRKMHRINLSVIERINGTVKKVQNAKVIIISLDTNLVKPKNTNTQGQVSFLFNSDAKIFQFKVVGPSDKDYEEKHFTLVDSCSKEYRQLGCELKRAGRISGKVFVGTEVMNRARVFLNVSSTNTSYELQDFSKGDGTYLIRNIPYGTHTFFAVKGGTIGDSAKVVLSEDGIKIYVSGTINNQSFQGFLPAEKVDFHLKQYNDMDITELLGIPIEITKFIPYPDNSIKISGRLINLPTTKSFDVDANTNLTFSDIYVKAGAKLNANGIPFIEPVTKEILTDKRTIELNQILGSFNGALKKHGTGVLKVADYQNSGDGYIEGRVAISAGSFQTGNAIGFPTDSIWLSNTSGSLPGKLNIPVVASGSAASELESDKFGVNDYNGKSLKFSLHNFYNSAIADSSESFAESGKLLLKTRLITNIQNITPHNLNIDLGTINVTNSSVSNVNSNQELTVNLEQWKLVSENWSFNSNGLVLHNGTLKTDLIDVPFTKDLPVTPTKMEADKTELDFSSMTVAGFLPLQVDGDVKFLYDQSIGYNEPKGHWVLRILPNPGSTKCASITGQRGMAQGESLIFDSFILLSDASSIFSIDKTTPPIHLFNVATFQPNKIVVFPGRINIPGSVDLGIPLCGAQTTSIDYYKDGGNIGFNLTPVPLAYDTKGVHVEYPNDANYPQKLDESGFTARGFITEPGKYKLYSQLSRTVDSTVTWLEPNQVLAVNSNETIRLEDLFGSMRATSNDWDYFWFDGDLVGAEGASGRLKFTVHGEIIANNEELSLKNIDTPFGNMSLTYDFETKTLYGELDFSQGIDVEAATVKGSAEMLFDSDGFYFLGGGSIDIKGVGAQAALLFGTHPMTDHIKAKFGEYSWIYQYSGKLPVTFPSTVKGFFAEGEAHIPVLIPDIEFNFFIVTGNLWIHIGGDTRMGLSFDGSPKLIRGFTVYGEAGAGLGASVVIACAGASGSAIVAGSVDGEVGLDGSWFVEGDVSFKLCGKAYTGFGACDSDCGGKFCKKKSRSGCKMGGLNIHLGSDYNSIDPYIQ